MNNKKFIVAIVAVLLIVGIYFMTIGNVKTRIVGEWEDERGHKEWTFWSDSSCQYNAVFEFPHFFKQIISPKIKNAKTPNKCYN